MRGNSVNVFTGHLGESGKAKTVSPSAGIWSFHVNNEHYDIAFENYDIMNKVYYIV